MAHHVFVFGTLKEGFPNFMINRGVRVLGPFLTLERYPLYLVGERFSPWLMDAPGEGEQVMGQLYLVDSAGLQAMDQLERITEPDGYTRSAISVESQDCNPKKQLQAFAYLKRRDLLESLQVRLGPLAEYTLEHAALYRSRTPAIRL